MAGLNVFAGGAWRKAKTAYVFASGAWRKAKAVWVFTGGAWRKMSFSDTLRLTVGEGIFNDQPPEYHVGFGVGTYGTFGAISPASLSNGNAVYFIYTPDYRPDTAVLSLLGNAPGATYTVAVEGYGTLVFSNMVSGYSATASAPGFYNWLAARKGQTINLTVTIS